MNTWKNDGLEISYEAVEKGEPFLFLHGLGGSLEQPKEMLDPLKGCRLIMPDQRGHGGTRTLDLNDRGKMNFDLLADDMANLMSGVSQERFLAGGISMGAGVCVNLALRYPERIKKLVLVRTAWVDGPMPQRFRTWFQALADFLKTGDREGFLASDAFRDIQAESSYTAESFLSQFQREDSLLYYEKYSSLPACAPFASLEDLKRLTMPVLILSTHMDPIHDFHYGEIYKSHIPNAVFREITPKTTDPAAYRADFNRCLREFYRD